MVSFGAESFLKALLDLFEGVIEIRTDESIVAAADDGDEEAVTTLADDGSSFLGEFEAFLKLAICVFQLGHEAAEIVADLFRVRVSRGVVTGVADE